MKLYGKKVLGSKINKRVSDRKETVDGVVYDIQSQERYAIVKIQGSENPIRAYYPENWEKTPKWLKKGNAIRMSRTGGNRNRIEISGHGLYVPTGQFSFPQEIGGLPDAVISGLEVIATDPASMNVFVTGGSFRFEEDIYYLAAIKMDNPAFIMGSTSGSQPMGAGGETVRFAAASTTAYRIDLLVIGVDGVLDIIKGNNYSDNPVAPPVPAGHFLLAQVLIPPKTTQITQDFINFKWEAHTTTAITVTGAGMYYGIANLMDCRMSNNNTVATIETKLKVKATILDQYRQPFSANHEFVIYILAGHVTLEGGARTLTLFTGGSSFIEFILYRTVPTDWGEQYYLEEEILNAIVDIKCTTFDGLSTGYIIDIKQPPIGIIPTTINYVPA